MRKLTAIAIRIYVSFLNFFLTIPQFIFSFSKSPLFCSRYGQKNSKKMFWISYIFFSSLNWILCTFSSGIPTNYSWFGLDFFEKNQLWILTILFRYNHNWKFGDKQWNWISLLRPCKIKELSSHCGMELNESKLKLMIIGSKHNSSR